MINVNGKLVSELDLGQQILNRMKYVPTWNDYSLTQLSSDGFEIQGLDRFAALLRLLVVPELTALLMLDRLRMVVWLLDYLNFGNDILLR